ncbi:MAG: RNB domain-containing ribonuclease [Acidobacteriota bacterium]
MSDPSLRVGVLTSEDELLEPSWDGDDAPGESRAVRRPLAPSPGLRAAVGGWVRFAEREGTAEIVEVLAEPETAAAALWTLAADRGPGPDHPTDVNREADALAAAPGIDDPSLDDLTSLPFVTIDEPHSKDLDQALFVEDTPSGGHVVWYAIADAAHFVRPNSALFQEALRRGATFYLPGLVLPMLPKLLSEDLVSINPGVDRRALVFEMELDRDGEVVRSALRRARVHSHLKTSYDAVQAYYDRGEGPTQDADPGVLASLDRLKVVGRRRIERREALDIVDIRRREISVRLDGDVGGTFVALADPRNDVERYNEQISLLANVEGARFLARGDRDDDGIEPIYRFHQAPGSHDLRQLERQIDDLVRLQRLDPDRWRWNRGRRSLAEYLRSLPADGRDGRVARGIHRQAILAGGRSGFDVVPGIHHGVGAEVYARFTAPMREIVGVFVHKEAIEKLAQSDGANPGDDGALREQVVEAANRAKQRQREIDKEVNRLVLDQLFRGDLADRGRSPRTGTVLGISRSKVHVQLDDPPIDIKVYHRHLEGRRKDGRRDRVRQGRDRVSLRRSRGGAVLWRVGDAVRVRVIRYDEEHDRWHLDLLAAADPLGTG